MRSDGASYKASWAAGLFSCLQGQQFQVMLNGLDGMFRIQRSLSIRRARYVGFEDFDLGPT